MENYEITLSASKMTYQVEAMRLLNHNKTLINNYIDASKKLKTFPVCLEYLSSFYDEKTGSSGTLFYNNLEENYILAYTGTNPYTDAQKDIETDIYGILMGQGSHYLPCFRFYKNAREKYGDNIILTGHSLGGNIAQRVAIEFDVKHTYIYNSAPIYIKDGVDLLMDVNDNNRTIYTKRIRKYRNNIQKINKKIEKFTGEIVHFSSEEDILNRLMSLLGDEAVYVGKNYILKGAGWHSLKLMEQSNVDIIRKIISKESFSKESLAKNYVSISRDETLTLRNVAQDRKLSLEYFFELFLGNDKVGKFFENVIKDIDMNKFFLYLVEKIDNKEN
ncbi:DUF2974 domain-containing protein [Gemella sp. GH3]|uniref:DUF2974 domain-containing protein n=1 Tax=unclassified Gemella TaxID=2624949 RepID=UPI0015CFEAD9|nr:MULTISPECIES: DUF2974 domain-containing protein [unclassified Gemella]MBF0713674.1 DUF2974 domain-containing protein [Gemella sp. GH3.1]NYS50626.1 DUF2974 domain-containing protein [Gemella sp. GH3]